MAAAGDSPHGERWLQDRPDGSDEGLPPIVRDWDILSAVRGPPLGDHFARGEVDHHRLRRLRARIDADCDFPSHLPRRC